MHLYVKSGQVATEILGITLGDGHIPRVGNQTPKTLEDRQPIKIEPALWFKVLLFDSVSVDCDRRVIMWSSMFGTTRRSQPTGMQLAMEQMSSPTKEKRHRISDSVYIGGEVVGSCHSDLDHLYEQSAQLLGDYVHSYITMPQFNASFLQLLHCYILPAISLGPDDVMKLEEIYQNHAVLIEQVDQEILAKEKQLDDVLQRLKHQRDNFVQQLQSLEDARKNLTPNQVFFDKLYLHIEEDIKTAWTKVDEYQRQVEANRPETAMYSLPFDNARKSRDIAWKEHQALLLARENLRAVKENYATLKRKKTMKTSFPVSLLGKKKQSESDQCDQSQSAYFVVEEMAAQVRQEFCDLSDKKMLMLSVREAMNGALKDLKSGQKSVGYDLHISGRQHATDVLNDSKLPVSWLSISQQVCALIQDKTTPVSQKHSQKCHEILDLCKDIETSIRKSNLLNSGSHSSATESSGGHSEENFSRLTESGELVTLDQNRLNENKAKVDELKRIILKHIHEMCKIIADHLTSDAPKSTNNIWLTYEPHFYNDVMKTLSGVYTAAHLNIRESFENDMKDLDLADLYLCETYLCEMLEDLDEPFTTDSLLSEVEIPTEHDSGCDSRPESEQAPTLTQISNPEQEPAHTPTNPPSSSNPAPSSTSPASIKDTIEDPTSPVSIIESTLGAVRDSMRDSMTSPLLMVYGRRTWPVLEVTCSGAVVGEEATSIDAQSPQAELCSPVYIGGHPQIASRKSCKKSIVLCQQYKLRFESIWNDFEEVIHTDIPFVKLQLLTRILREMNEQITLYLQQENARGTNVACADDLVDLLVILLCNTPPSLVSQLYSQIQMLVDILPPFFDGGHYCYTLVQFSVAYQFIQTRIMFKKRKLDPESTM